MKITFNFTACLGIIRKLFLVIISVLVSSCLAGLHDDAIDLGSGYTLIAESKDMRYIRPNTIYSDIIIYPTVTKYCYNKDFIIAMQHPNRKLAAQILASNLSSRRNILQKSDEVDSLGEKRTVQHLDRPLITDETLVKIFQQISDRNSIDDIRQSVFIADSLLKVVPELKRGFENDLNYWIISKVDNKLHGPFDMQEYRHARNNLGIQEDLQFTD